MMILMANKSDLTHMQSVKQEQHDQFTSKCQLHSSHYVSAKTGDQIPQTFYKIAADLAGIKVTKPMMEVVAQKQIVAEIQTGYSQNVKN